VNTRVAKCGTDSGYFKHRRLGEKPCDPCRLAHNAAVSAGKPRSAKPHCGCGKRIKVPGVSECSVCRKKTIKKRADEELISQTVIKWKVGKNGVRYAAVVEDPIPDGPTRASARAFQDIA
jgi:hypothetical protein